MYSTLLYVSCGIRTAIPAKLVLDLIEEQESRVAKRLDSGSSPE
jgi:hypothetical protein